MLEAIFWDNDGVLVDTETLFFAANREIMREQGVELGRETFVEWSLRRGHSIFEILEESTEAERNVLRARRDQVYEVPRRGCGKGRDASKRHCGLCLCIPPAGGRRPPGGGFAGPGHVGKLPMVPTEPRQRMGR